MAHLVTRRIEIDAGHRIMTHGSKCRHIHGHRYVIEATCCDGENHLHRSGEQTDMVVDFGFLKQEMKHHIDAPCDHGFITSQNDTQVLEMFAPKDQPFEGWLSGIQSEVGKSGFCSAGETHLNSKLYIIGPQPTAECLAQHWFARLEASVAERSGGLARLLKVRVWETPNCWAEYSE